VLFFLCIEVRCEKQRSIITWNNKIRNSNHFDGSKDNDERREKTMQKVMKRYSASVSEPSFFSCKHIHALKLQINIPSTVLCMEQPLTADYLASASGTFVKQTSSNINSFLVIYEASNWKSEFVQLDF